AAAPSHCTTRAGAREGQDHHRGPKKSCGAAGQPDSGRPDGGEVMTAVLELAPLVGVVAACSALGYARATFYRQNAPAFIGPRLRRPKPPRALSTDERADVLAVLDSDRFADKPPRQVYAELLDEERYLCSVRTMYRLLAEAGQVRERRDQLRHPVYAKPELLA